MGELHTNYFGKAYGTCAEMLCTCLLKASFHEPTLVLCIVNPLDTSTLQFCVRYIHCKLDRTSVVCKRLKLIWNKLCFSGVRMKIAFLDIQLNFLQKGKELM